MNIFLIFLFFILLAGIKSDALPQTTYTKEEVMEDFEYLWNTINEEYVYFDKKQTDWEKVKKTYTKRADGVKTRQEALKLFEDVISELYDDHSSLNANNNRSPRLVPTGLSVWAEWQGDKAVITGVKESGLNCFKELKPGAEIISINDVPVKKAVEMIYPLSIVNVDGELKNWALRRALAGTYNNGRIIKISYDGVSTDIDIDSLDKCIEDNPVEELLQAKVLSGNIGYIKINNSLGDYALISEFDSALKEMKNTDGLILDLRNTPSGGNSLVARGIMGRFIDKELPYQKHSFTESELKIKRSFIEMVSPRGEFVYDAPLAILVGRWTGSMGEGIAIGFDAMKRGTVVGTKMAGLNGAIYTFKMPNTGIGFNIPIERLYHIDGTPREEYIPEVLIDLTEYPSELSDIILDRAVEVIKEGKNER